MIIRVQRRDNPFVQIDKRPLEDSRLSWKAKGLLAHLLCKPDNWEVSVQDLIERSKDGRESVQSALKELREYGYAELKVVQNEQGKLMGKTWVIKEMPELLPTDGFPVFREPTDERVSRQTVSPTDGKPATSNNNYSNNEIEREEPAPSKFQMSLIDRAKQIEKDRPGLPRNEYRLFAIIDQVREYMIQYPATVEVLTGGLTYKARLLKKDSTGKNQLGAEVEKWIRHNGLNSAIVSNATNYLTTGQHSLVAWLRMWDRMEGKELKQEIPAYVTPGNVF